MTSNTRNSVSSILFRRNLLRTLANLFCLVIAIVAFYPFFVMVVSSTHDNFNIMSKINILPGNNLQSTTNA